MCPLFLAGAKVREIIYTAMVSRLRKEDIDIDVSSFRYTITLSLVSVVALT